MVKKGKIDGGIFKGSTLNTPLMLAVEDYIDALEWSSSIGGLPGLVEKSESNLAVLESFVEANEWAHFLAQDPATRSCTSVCLTLDLTPEQIKKFVAVLESEDVAYDIGGYRDAPPSIRIWCGATVEKEDLEALVPWMEWAYNALKAGDL